LDTAPFIAEIMTVIGYVMIFVGIYKLFQITSELGEIKELLKSQRAFPASGPSGAADAADAADAYAQNLLRAVNQESHEVEQTAARQD
jgi:hypothetical protein